LQAKSFSTNSFVIVPSAKCTSPRKVTSSEDVHIAAWAAGTKTVRVPSADQVACMAAAESSRWSTYRNRPPGIGVSSDQVPVVAKPATSDRVSLSRIEAPLIRNFMTGS
jgi:hypothetical protein